MQCGSCGEEIPADSIFCPECGARQDLSRAGGFTAPNAVGLSGQEVTGGRSFGVVSGEAIRHQREMSVTDPNACLLYTSPSPRDRTRSRMPSSA